MRAYRWMLLLLLVPAACQSSPPALTGEAGEVTVILRGLIALEKTDAGLRVLFLSSTADPHPPTLSVDLAKLSGPPGVLPDLTIPDELGRGIAAWHIEEVTLETGNIEETSIAETETPVKDMVTDADKANIRWIPHMEDIYGAKQTMTDSPDLVAARGLFAAGRLEPIFDAAKNKTQRFTIGARECTAVADGARLQVKMKDSLKPLLTFKKGAASGQILVHPGTTIALAALPQNQPQGDLTHFHHYFGLLQNAEAKLPTECTGTNAAAPTGYPVRCAPIKFP